MKNFKSMLLEFYSDPEDMDKLKFTAKNGSILITNHEKGGIFNF